MKCSSQQQHSYTTQGLMSNEIAFEHSTSNDPPKHPQKESHHHIPNEHAIAFNESIHRASVHSHNETKHNQNNDDDLHFTKHSSQASKHNTQQSQIHHSTNLHSISFSRRLQASNKTQINGKYTIHPNKSQTPRAGRDDQITKPHPLTRGHATKATHPYTRLRIQGRQKNGRIDDVKEHIHCSRMVKTTGNRLSPPREPGAGGGGARRSRVTRPSLRVGPLEPAGDGRPRWMAAGRGSAARRPRPQNPAYSPTRPS